ncbi:uncharacterized protein N7473_000438 [Penicillium subrubescens]|uniref:uncharacterized protein n=1 Tax=Penicillium subrubescens TaxID=1316194 RepID=UPI002545A86D|nr:uncharacterized protein N7473_000438 [Penicillium subrubescens]KAJ5911135.1 hypothetical protein N7473_000438 [Penicillium subrubescens]
MPAQICRQIIITAVAAELLVRLTVHAFQALVNVPMVWTAMVSAQCSGLTLITAVAAELSVFPANHVLMTTVSFNIPLWHLLVP